MSAGDGKPWQRVGWLLSELEVLAQDSPDAAGALQRYRAHFEGAS